MPEAPPREPTKPPQEAVYLFMGVASLFPRTIALEKGPDVVLFDFFARPRGFAEEGETRIDARIFDEALDFNFLSE